MNITGTTRFVTLLGHPVAHSLSPLIHNTAFQAQGLDFVYTASPVAADRVEAAVLGLKALGAAGANVTIPHKQAVLPLMDTLSDRAQAIGAVNTIVCQQADGTVRLHGDNTDPLGFLDPLRGRTDLRAAEMLIWGAGGAARAVVYGLLTEFHPARLTLVARTPAKAKVLAADFAHLDANSALRVRAWNEATTAVRGSRLLVNTTPLGMHGRFEQATPWESSADFTPSHTVYDLVYTPHPTRLLREAAARGSAIIGGLPMLVGQAAASYQQWTGQAMPTDVVFAALADLGFTA
ncbi:MAG: shikimate dehydrogenase [Bacteroidota bacterium]